MSIFGFLKSIARKLFMTNDWKLNYSKVWWYFWAPIFYFNSSKNEKNVIHLGERFSSKTIAFKAD